MTTVQVDAAPCRADSLPPDAVCYWRSGIFDQQSLPAGLTREHRLKDGTWGLVTLLSGRVGFTWDDAEGGAVELTAPATMVVPPTVPHHVEIRGPFALQVEFFREPQAAVPAF
jgi:tellurite resistance-related uncharacterized protein